MRNVIFFCCFRKPLGGQSTLPQTRDFHFTAPQARAPLHGGRRMKIGSEFRRGGGRKVTSDQWPVTSDQRPVTGDQWPVTSASATAGARGASLRASARSACPEGDRKAPLPPPPLSHSWRSTPELTIEPRDGGGLNPAGARCGSAVDGTAVFFSPFLFCYFLITHKIYRRVHHNNGREPCGERCFDPFRAGRWVKTDRPTPKPTDVGLRSFVVRESGTRSFWFRCEWGS